MSIGLKRVDIGAKSVLEKVPKCGTNRGTLPLNHTLQSAVNQNNRRCKTKRTRITNQISQIAKYQRFGLFLFSELSANCLQTKAQTKVWGHFLPLRRLRSASNASRKWISTGESWYWVRSRNLSYSVSAFSLAISADTLPA